MDPHGMKEAATIAFRDADSSEDALAIVHYDERLLSLTLSLPSDGDVVVFMDKNTGKRLVDALTTALGPMNAA